MTVTLLLKYRVSLQQQTHSVTLQQQTHSRIDMTVTLLLKYRVSLQQQTHSRIDMYRQDDMVSTTTIHTTG